MAADFFKKHNPWDVLAWIAFGIVVAYFLLKAVGILNSPPLADILAIGSASYFLGRQVMKLDYLHKDVEVLKVDVKVIKEDLNKHAADEVHKK